jgi:hypothetical protein
MIHDLNKNNFDGFWLNDTLQDCGEMIVVEYEEKLNNDHLINYSITITNNNEPKSRTRNRRTKKSSGNIRINIKSNSYETTTHGHRTQITTPKFLSKSNSSKHNNLYKIIPSDHYKGKMLQLSKNSDIYLHESRQKQILLDSYTKP